MWKSRSFLSRQPGAAGLHAAASAPLAAAWPHPGHAPPPARQGDEPVSAELGPGRMALVSHGIRMQGERVGSVSDSKAPCYVACMGSGLLLSFGIPVPGACRNPFGMEVSVQSKTRVVCEGRRNSGINVGFVSVACSTSSPCLLTFSL